MRAVILDSPGQMKVGQLETPRLSNDEVLVTVGAAGICAGDLYIYQGRNPYAQYPQICGHEIAGKVVEVGDEVKDIEPGTRVIVEPFIGCGSCYTCRIGKPNCCPKLTILGVNRAGGYAEFLTAPAKNIHPIPNNLPYAKAALTEPVAIAVQACRRGNVTSGDCVLVLGCGPIGLALIEVAKNRGAYVIASDLLPDKLKIAEDLGAETLKADGNLKEHILDRTNGEGAHVVIEATGSIKALEQTIELVASGGRIVVVGLMKAGLGATFPALDFTRKEITIVGSRASVNCFDESLKLITEGKIKMARVATELDLWDAPKIFADLTNNPNSIQKTILTRELKD
jgi:L-gulonate 5-dehydrogenase